MRVVLSVCLTAIIMATAARTASAGLVISTPTGLNPGDHFRIMFLTTGTTNATSSDISTYDTFVNTDANNATYNGSIISWQAIGSTTSVNAITHIGITGDAVYNVDGTKVASYDDTSGLWSGSLLNGPDNYLDGSNTGKVTVWTGTDYDGTATAGQELGSSQPTYGVSGNTFGGWVSKNHLISAATTFNLYGISSDLVVPAVPEPSTAVLTGLGGLAGLAYSFARKRK